MKSRLLAALLACLPALVGANAASAPTAPRAALQAPDWRAIEAQARGQTVYFNAWGGGEAINAYIQWAAQEVKTRHGVEVRHVKVSNTADVVKRVQTEHAAGRRADGSVDLLWVNGENFRQLKQAGLLFGPWAEALPAWRGVDLGKPVRSDFSVPTEGHEAPWGTAQLTFIADQARTPVVTVPRSARQWLAFAQDHPGRLTYPRPPDFHGVTFLKQLLIELAPDRKPLQQPVTPEAFARATAPLWQYLEQLHPQQWRGGKAFPASAAEMNRMLADGELKLSLTFNPNEAANLITARQLPATAFSFGFSNGTIGNVHFLAIPINASAKAGAQVFANFLLSPEAQARKADTQVWGDPTVLDLKKLTAPMRARFQTTAPGALTEAVPTLAEPHASWAQALEAEWTRRYGGAGR